MNSAPSTPALVPRALELIPPSPSTYTTGIPVVQPSFVPDSNNGVSPVPVAAIVGVAAGVTAGVVLLVAVIMFSVRRRMKNARKAEIKEVQAGKTVYDSDEESVIPSCEKEGGRNLG
jgi:hypothetical protein